MITNDRRLDRRAAIRTLLENRDDLLLVTGLGSTTYDAASVGDDDRNFYLWGAMGARGDGRAGAGDRPARPAHPRRHRRRRDADGAGRIGDDWPAATAESGDRGVRQRPLWRNRHAGEPHR